MKTLILGGIKSGKSRIAENIVKSSNKKVFYIATSVNNDEEMKVRVQSHQEFRPADWTTIEEPIFLAGTLIDISRKGNYILVDCLTLWLTNLLLSKDNSQLETEIEKLLNAISKIEGDVIFVSNETNLGIIPMSTLARKFCDQSGILHQKIASLCDQVIFTVAGLPQVIKGEKIE